MNNTHVDENRPNEGALNTLQYVGWLLKESEEKGLVSKDRHVPMGENYCMHLKVYLLFFTAELLRLCLHTMLYMPLLWITAIMGDNDLV